MQGSWEADKRKHPYDFADELTGFERSTSAPPPETDFLFRPQSDALDPVLGHSILPGSRELYPNSSDVSHQQEHHHQQYQQQTAPLRFTRNHPLPSSPSMSNA
eukprot:jgi/Psemu1/300000/fgenesh1_kg.5_\